MFNFATKIISNFFCKSKKQTKDKLGNYNTCINQKNAIINVQTILTNHQEKRQTNKEKNE